MDWMEIIKLALSIAVPLGALVAAYFELRLGKVFEARMQKLEDDVDQKLEKIETKDGAKARLDNFVQDRERMLDKRDFELRTAMERVLNGNEGLHMERHKTLLHRLDDMAQAAEGAVRLSQQAMDQATAASHKADLAQERITGHDRLAVAKFEEFDRRLSNIEAGIQALNNRRGADPK